MTPADVRAALVECLLGVAEERPRLASLAPRLGRGRGLLALARVHAVAETAAHVLLAPRLAGAVPGALAAALRRTAEEAAASNALLLHDAARIQAALAAEGIPSVALKGTALLARHYPHPAARHVSDLDLLVAPADVARADALLRERLGLVRAPSAIGVGFDGAPAAPAESADHLPPLLTPAGTTCELHHRPPGDDPALDAAAVLARAGEATRDGATLRVPSPDDLLAVACAHVLGHHRDEPRFLPRHLADLAVLVATGATFAGARRLVGDPAPLDASEALLARARAGETRALFTTRRGRLARLVATAVAPGGGASPWRRAFPARAFLAERYGAPRDAPWLPLLWLWRPLRAAIRAVRGR